jgi:hypothetical protein
MIKAQIEITNMMLMHILGIIGIVLFTLLFISLMSGSEARASALQEETIYYNYARRIITSPDCLAYEGTEAYFDGSSAKIQLISKTYPGIVDMSKLFDFEHLNCLRYDLVSGAIADDPKNNEQPFPLLLYEIDVYDTDLDKSYSFSSTAYQSRGFGQTKEICKPTQAISAYPKTCLISCNELVDYLGSPDTFETEKTSLEGLTNIPSTVNPGINCWDEDFNDAAREVVPYYGIKCSSIPESLFEGYSYGKAFQTSNQYYSRLRYRLNDGTFQDHNGIIDITFCVINIPSMCDPFFEGESLPTALNELFGIMGIDSTQIYNKELCESRGLPLI